MAGGPRDPAGTTARGAIRLPAPIGELSRQHVVHLILSVMLLLVALGTLVDALWTPEVRSPFPVGETAVGVAFCCVIALLLAANGRGYWRFATWTALGCLTLSGSIFFDLATLDRMLIVSAVPVAVAAFVLRPRAAFEFAGLSAALYTAEWLHHGPVPGYNFISLLALAGVALVLYLVARRVEWLEEAEDIYRHELDRLADERDVLKGQVSALADELEEREASEAEERRRPLSADARRLGPR